MMKNLIDARGITFSIGSAEKAILDAKCKELNQSRSYILRQLIRTLEKQEAPVVA